MTTGHLFVVHGTIESLIHDATVVPVGSEYRFSRIWRPLVGDRPDKPRAWPERHWGRIANAPDRVWAVGVGGATADAYGQILDRVVKVLRRVDERRDAHPLRRGSGSLPLVAVPVIGIGRGGYARNRGEVVRALVRRLSAEAAEIGVDVALVTPDPAVYAAAQYARRDLLRPLPHHLEEAAVDLGRAAREGDLALLLGAGVSAAAGLPTWHRLVEQLASQARLTGVELDKTKLSAIDQAELVELHGLEQATAAAGDEIRTPELRGRERLPVDFQHQVAAIASSVDRSSLLHGQLAGLDCREVITTNYDLLYEQAVHATGRDISSVMPWASAHRADRWVLKLHGDVDHPGTIVLTRRHMVRYDSVFRPSGALLQSLLLTKKLLVVGTSMTDDNVIRLLLEVQAYRSEHQGDAAGTFGTVLDADGDPARARLWKGQLDWLFMNQVGGPAGDNGFRGVEIFLDRVAHHASRDSSWVLDERFAGLLTDDEERRLAESVRRLAADLPTRSGTKWSPLVERLREMGAQF